MREITDDTERAIRTQIELALRRERIIPVAIPLPNLSIRPMDKKLSALILGDLTPTLDSFRLGIVNAANPLGTATRNSPSVAVRNYVM